MKATMPLELSDSEAFWLAIVCRKMGHLKIGDDQGKDCEYGIDVDAHPEPYNELLDLAVEFGIATPPQTERLPPDCPPPPADTNWFMGLEPLSTEDLRELSADFRKTVDESRARLSALADNGKSVEAFEDHCSTALVGIYGHSRSNPSVFYGMTGDGTLRALFRCFPRPEGLFKTLLQHLDQDIPFSPLEYLALAGTRRFESTHVWADTWWKYIGHFPLDKGIPGIRSDENAYETLQSLATPHKERLPWRSGDTLAALDELLNSFADNLKGVMNAEQGKPGNNEAGNALPDLEVPADELQKVLLRHKIDCRIAELMAQRPPEEMGVDYGLWISHDMAEEEFVSAIKCCEEAHLDAVACVLRSAASTFRTCARVVNLTDGDAEQAAEEVPECIATTRRAQRQVRDAMKLAYGELRLRQLHWDEAAMATAAIGGWVLQKETIQAAIKEGMTQMDDGKPPYVVLCSMQGAIESLIRQIATKYLSGAPGNKVAGIMGDIRKRGLDLRFSDNAEKKNEGEHILWLLSLAEALYGIRCRVVHDPEYPFTRHDAGLFFHGIAVLLTHV